MRPLFPRKFNPRAKSLLINLIGLTIFLLPDKVLAQAMDEVRQPLFTEQSIEIIGNTVFSDSELKTILAPLKGEEITPEKLLRAQKAINNYYRSRGYLRSGSLLLSQELDSQIQIQIIEGTLIAIQIKGLKNLSENYLQSRLPPTGKPLNLNHLLKSLDRLGNEPLIKKLKAEIVQKSIGQTLLVLDVEEHQPLEVQVTVIDGYSRSIGPLGGNIKVTRHHFFAPGDRARIDHSQTEGLRRTGLFYFLPINQLGGGIMVSYNTAKSKLVEEVIKDLGVEADYQSLQVALEQPIFFTSSESLVLGLGIEIIDSETFVLGGDFSFAFTEGLKDGQSQITVLRFTQEYLKKGQTTLLSVRSQFNLGIDAFDATRTEVGIDGIYSSWRGQFHYLKAFNETKDLVLATRLSFQITPDKLLPLEQFTMGGLGSVRGYAANLVVADSGVVGTIELRIPIINGKWGKISIIPFFDVGTIWNNERETTGSNTFASLGLGVRYQLGDALEIIVNYGVPVVEAKGFGETKTENRLTASARVNLLRF